MKSRESVGSALPVRPSNAIHFNTGLVPFKMGSAGAEFCGSDFSICFVASVAGPTLTIELTIAQLSMTNEISGGTVTVTNNNTGATLFQSSVATGEVSLTVGNVLVDGTIEPSATVKGGSFEFLIGFGGETVVSFASISAIPVPEPSTPKGPLLGGGLAGSR